MITYKNKDSMLEVVYNLQQLCSKRHMIHPVYGKCKLEIRRPGLMYISWNVYNPYQEKVVIMGVSVSIADIDKVVLDADTISISATMDCTRDGILTDRQTLGFECSLVDISAYKLLETDMAEEMKIGIL